MFYANLIKNSQAPKPAADVHFNSQLSKQRERAEEEILNRLNSRKSQKLELKNSDFEKTLDLINNFQDK
jgi:hypothetical protein